MKSISIKNRIDLAGFSAALFFTGLTVELLILLVDKSALTNPWEGQLFRVTFLLFALKIFLTKYSLKEWFWVATMILPGIAVYLSTGENVIIRAAVFVAAMKGLKLRPVIQYVLWITLLGSIIIVLLAFGGILGSVAMTDEFREGIMRNIYSFGMGHSNAAHTMFLMIILLILYVYSEKMSVWILGALFVVNGVFFLFTDSKTGVAVTAMAILMAGIMKGFPQLWGNRLIYLLAIAGFLIAVGFSIWAAANSIGAWHNPTLFKIDSFLTGRMINLYWGSNAHAGAIETWTLFSAPEHLEYYFDMGWVRLFYWFGIIPGGILAVMLILLIWQCYRKRDYMGLVMIVSLIIYTVIEAHIISVYLARNYLLLLFGAYWSDIFHTGLQQEKYIWTIRGSDFTFRKFRKERVTDAAEK